MIKKFNLQIKCEKMAIKKRKEMVGVLGAIGVKLQLHLVDDVPL